MSITTNRLKGFILAILLVSGGLAQGQILISLIFGDKLNSEGVEFGLTGGITNSQIGGLSDQGIQVSLNLGFYFDFKINERWWFNTGVLVISRQGTNKIKGEDLEYFYNDTISIDPILDEGHFGQAINYFNVPLLIKYRHPKHIFVEGGFMLGLRTKAGTYYSVEEEVGSMEFVYYNSDLFNRLDAGVMAGFGYKLLQGKGMNIGVRYYLGLTDIYVGDEAQMYNRTMYFFADIPIGANKETFEE